MAFSTQYGQYAHLEFVTLVGESLPNSRLSFVENIDLKPK